MALEAANLTDSETTEATKRELEALDVPLGPEVPPRVYGGLRGEVELKVARLTVLRGALAREARHTSLAVAFAWWGQDPNSSATAFRPLVRRKDDRPVGPAATAAPLSTNTYFPVRSSPAKLAAYLRDAQTLELRVVRAEEATTIDGPSFGVATLELQIAENVDLSHLTVDGVLPVRDPASGTEVATLEVSFRVGLGPRHSSLLALVAANEASRKNPPLRLGRHVPSPSLQALVQGIESLPHENEPASPSDTMTASALSFEMNEVRANLAATASQGDSRPTSASSFGIHELESEVPPSSAPRSPQQQDRPQNARTAPPSRRRQRATMAADLAIELGGNSDSLQHGEKGAAARLRALRVIKSLRSRGVGPPTPRAQTQTQTQTQTRRANTEENTGVRAPGVHRQAAQSHVRSSIKSPSGRGTARAPPPALAKFLAQAERLRNEMDRALDSSDIEQPMVSPGPSQENALVVYPDGPSFAGHRPSSPWYEEPRFPESGVLASAYAPGVGIINASGETADLETWIPQLLHEIGDTVGFPTDPLLAAMQPVTAAVAAGLRSVESVEFMLSEIDANPNLWSHKSSSHDVKPDFSIECRLEFPRSGNSPGADEERIVKSSVQLSARNRSTRSQPVTTGTTRRRSSATPSDRNADRPKPGPSKTKLDLSTTHHVHFDQATLEKWLSGYLRVSLLRDGIPAATGALALRTIVLANDPHTAVSLRLLDCAGIAGTVAELATQSASVTGDQVLATLQLEITMTSSQDAATRRAEMSFARAQSAALLKGRSPQPPTTLPPRAPQADGYHLRLVLDRLETAKGSSASSIEALHEPIQLQHQTGAHGYVTLSEATRSVEYPGSTVRRPFIMEAYDAHGSLIGLAKLPESFKLPFSDWVSVRDPFTGKDRLFAHIRLEEMAVANTTDVPRPITPPRHPHTEESSPPQSPFKRSQHSPPLQHPVTPPRHRSPTVPQESPSSMHTGRSPSSRKGERKPQQQRQDSPASRQSTPVARSSAGKPTSTTSRESTPAKSSAPSQLSSVRSPSGRGVVPGNGDDHFVETTAVQHVFVFELGSLCYRADLAGALVTYRFPLVDEGASIEDQQLHEHELWWDSVVEENNTIGRHLIETTQADEILAEWLARENDKIRFRVLAPPPGANESEVREDALATLSIRELAALYRGARRLSDTEDQQAGGGKEEEEGGMGATQQTARASAIFRLPLLPARSSPAARKQKVNYLKVAVRYLQYETRQWVRIETLRKAQGPSGEHATSRTRSDAQSGPRRVRASDNKLDEARARLCVQVVRVSGLEQLARLAAKQKEGASSMHLAAAVGVNAFVDVSISVGAHQLRHRTAVEPRSFEPAFNEEVSIEFALDKEVLDALGRAEAVIRVWHQEPNAAMAKGQTVLLGSARVSLRDLLLSQSGARGDFALTSPVDANIDDKTRAHPPLGHVRAAIFFEHHRELAQYFPPNDLSAPFSSAAHYIATDVTSVDDDDDDDDDDAFGEGGKHGNFEDVYKDSILPPESAATDEHLVVPDDLEVSLPLLTGEVEEGSDDDERIVLQAPLSTPLNDSGDAALSATQDRVESENDSMTQPSSASRGGGMLQAPLSTPLNDRGDAALSATQDRVESENDSMTQPLSASRGGGMLCVSVEEAMHLPMVLVRDTLQPPLPYVSFILYGPRFSDARHTQPNPDGSSCNPRWFEDLRLPIDNFGQLRDGILRFHVWHRASWQRESVEDHGSVVSEGGARHPPPGLDFDPYSNGIALQHRTIAETSAIFGDNDIHLGTAVVDLSTLDVGIDRVHGWYHVIDAEQRRVGQVKVKVSIVRASSGVKDNDFAATSAEESVSSNTFASREVPEKEDAKHDQDSEAAFSPAALADAMQSLDLISERLRMRMLRLENSSPAPQDNAGASADRQGTDEKEDQQENDGGITMGSQSRSNVHVEIPPSGASGELESLDLNDGVAPVEPPRPQDTETLHPIEIMHTLEGADNLSPHPFDGAAAGESIHTTSEVEGGIGKSDLVENAKTGEENHEVVKDSEETSSTEHISALAADDDAINAALDQNETAIEVNTTDGIFDGNTEEDIEKRQESADVQTPADATSGMVLEETSSELHEIIYGTQEAVSNDSDASKAHQVGETTSLARGREEEEEEEEEEEGTFDFEKEEDEKCVFGAQDVVTENDEARIPESRKGDIRFERSAFSSVNWNEEHEQVEEEEDSFAEQPTKGTLANPEKDSVSGDAEAYDGSRDSTLSPRKYDQSVNTVEGVGGFQEHDIDQVHYVVNLHANEEDQEEPTFAKSSNSDLDEPEFHGDRASQDPKAHESDSESSLSSEGAKSVLSTFAVDPMKMPDLPSTHYNQLAQVGPELPQAHICSGQEARVRRLSVSPIQVNEKTEVGTPSLFISEEKRRMAKKNTWMDPETARIARILRGDSSKASN